MKLSKEELKQKVNEVVSDDDIKISLLEDIEDSVEIDQSEKVEKSMYDDLETKYTELSQKYKDRFLNGDASEKIKDDDIKELKEEEVIDIREI